MKDSFTQRPLSTVKCFGILVLFPLKVTVMTRERKRKEWVLIAALYVSEQNMSLLHYDKDKKQD